jgi:hypothetical protein
MFFKLFGCTIFLFSSLAHANEANKNLLTAEMQPETIYQQRVKILMEKEIGIFESPPENFNHAIQVSACLIQKEGRILALFFLKNFWAIFPNLYLYSCLLWKKENLNLNISRF